MELPDDPKHGDRVQMEDAAFWYVYGEYGWYNEAIDERAVYGYPRLGDRDPESIEISIRKSSRDLVTAIRTVSEGDRVRVNDGNWMTVEDPENGFVDEGFACKYENGSVLYAVRPTNSSDNPPGTFHSPWMRRWDDHSSVGEVGCLEVDWA